MELSQAPSVSEVLGIANLSDADSRWIPPHHNNLLSLSLYHTQNAVHQRLIQPPRDALVMRTRPTPTSTEAVRPIPALRRRPGRRAVAWRPRRRGHPLAAGVSVSRSSALRRSGRRRAQVLLEHVSGQPTARDAAPALGARVEAHHDAGVQPPERLRAREGLGPHGDDRRGVGEGVSAALRFLSESRCRAERDG